MWVFCTLLGTIGFIVSVILLIKGRIKKSSFKKLLIWLVASLLLLFVGVTSAPNDSKVANVSNSNTSVTKEENENSEQTWASYYETQNIQVSEVDASVLFEYGHYYTGQTVCTVISIEDMFNQDIKARTDNNESFFFSFVMNFDDANEIKKYKKGNIVTVVGEVEKPSAIGKTINLNKCHIIGSGDAAQTKYNSIAAKKDEQIKYCNDLQAAADAEAAKQSKETEKEYKNACKTISYSEIERNPDANKGKKIKVTGKVVQVAEGWFDTVTLRVNSDGKDWYITYARKDNESRILDGDNVTVYGESKGVTTYTTVLGASKTVPSISAQYIDIK